MNIKDHARFNRNKGKHKQMIKMFLIPAIVVVLMCIIVIVDNLGTEEEVIIESVEPTQLETLVSVTEEAVEDNTFEAENFKENSNEGILDLMTRYFEARATANPELMNQVYGISEMEIGALEQLRTELWANAKYMEGCENVTTYVRETDHENRWLVYGITDIRFRAVETLAPMIMWGFVELNEDGKYYLKSQEELSQNELDFAKKSNESEEVRALAKFINNTLKNALLEDEHLSSVYGILNSGSPVWAEGAEAAELEVKILDLEESQSTEETEMELPQE